MRDIKRRKTSIQGTQQITKAMKLVSTVKLQRARAGAERSQTYFDCMYDTVNNILSRVGHLEHKYLVPGASPKKAVIVITSNRGLAGGYNSNVAKLITGQEEWKAEDVVVYAIGNKGREILERKGYTEGILSGGHRRAHICRSNASVGQTADIICSRRDRRDLSGIHTLQEHGEPRAEAVEASARGI